MTTLAVATQLRTFSTMAPIRRRLVFAPIGVCAVCTFQTLTTTVRYGLALSSPGPRRLFDGRIYSLKAIELPSSRYGNTGGDRGQRRSRSSRESGNNDAEFYGRGDGRRHRSDSGSRIRRDFNVDDYYTMKAGITEGIAMATTTTTATTKRELQA